MATTTLPTSSDALSTWRGRLEAAGARPVPPGEIPAHLLTGLSARPWSPDSRQCFRDCVTYLLAADRHDARLVHCIDDTDATLHATVEANALALSPSRLAWYPAAAYYRVYHLRPLMEYTVEEVRRLVGATGTHLWSPEVIRAGIFTGADGDGRYFGLRVPAGEPEPTVPVELPPRHAFKVLDWDGRDFLQGGQWSLPAHGRPGRWRRVDGRPLAQSQHGLHLATSTSLPYWASLAIGRVFLAEYKGESIPGAGGAIIARRVRLVEELGHLSPALFVVWIRDSLVHLLQRADDPLIRPVDARQIVRRLAWLVQDVDVTVGSQVAEFIRANIDLWVLVRDQLGPDFLRDEWQWQAARLLRLLAGQRRSA